MEGEHVNKSHKARTTGNKAVRKQETRKKKAGIELQPNRGNNPKAFIGRSAGSHKSKKALQSFEKRENIMHMPSADKTLGSLLNEPPMLVAVVGPPKCGKTTLIRSLVKFYSGQNVKNLQGPVTVVAGKARRITFIECPNTLAAMCDVSKVADLVLLMVDGDFGFEMETFEFLSISQVHGFPKTIGIVSHLDKLRNNKALKKRKKFLRHRFWHEVAQGAKLLCLSPMQQGMYRQTDILKLHRILICIETKVQQWRNTHSCMLADRVEDVTDPKLLAENPQANRTVAFYGYIRGHPLKENQMVHIAGYGDCDIQHLSRQDDPCPGVANTGNSQGHKMRSLTQKQRKMYAPYCDAAGIQFDEDAIYVHEDRDLEDVERTGKGLQMLRELQRAKAIDAGETELQTVRRPVKFADEENFELAVDAVEQEMSDDSESDDSSDDDVPPELLRGGDEEMNLDDFGYGNDEAEDDDDAEIDTSMLPRLPNDPDSVRINTVKSDWDEEDLRRRVKNLFVTGEWTAEERGFCDDDDEHSAPDVDSDAASDDSYGSKGYESLSEDGGDAPDADFGAAEEDDDDFDDEDLLDDMSDDEDEDEDYGEAPNRSRKRFEGGMSSTGGDGVELDEEAQDLVSHFISRKVGGAGVSGSGAADDSDLLNFDELQNDLAGTKKVDDDDEAPPRDGGEPGNEAEMNEYMKKKMAKKAQFDADYDVKGGRNTTSGYYNHLVKEADEKKQKLDDTMAMLGNDIDKKVAMVGYFSGLYVRLVIADLPVELLTNFDPKIPLLIGGLNSGEQQTQFVTTKFKKHRWYPRILKAQDPVVMSIGWRRIQTQPVFAAEDPTRARYLKYTPDHMHCIAAFRAPIAPPNTGFILIPAEEKKHPYFRLQATGFTVGNDVTTTIVKKLKITGTPQQIKKTTCFVKGMFNSDIEAAKFVGAKVKSVSGLRGMIKKVIKGKSGLVRCTFEDKLLMSDIVFIRAWKPVDPPRYCATVQTLLNKNWTGMRPMRELRHAYGVKLEQNKDSEYKDINRTAPKDLDDAKILMSRNLKMNLPYEMKEEFIPLERKRDVDDRVAAATTVAPEPREMRKQALLDAFSNKADAMQEQKKESRRVQKVKEKRAREKDEEQQLRKIKQAKKETARRQEFRSQHKVRK